MFRWLIVGQSSAQKVEEESVRESPPEKGVLCRRRRTRIGSSEHGYLKPERLMAHERRNNAALARYNADAASNRANMIPAQGLVHARH